MNDIHKICICQTILFIFFIMAKETKEIIERMQVAVGVTSKRQLAIHLGIGAQAVSNWIPTNRIPYKECAQIAIDKGISIEYLLTGEIQDEDVVYNIASLFQKNFKKGDYEVPTAHQFGQTMKVFYMAEKASTDVVNDDFIKAHLEQQYKKT